jgi:hypothetical protein
VRFRVTRSRDIRAPNLAELFSTGRQGTAIVTDPQNGNQRVGPFPTFPSGNLALVPERSDTFVAGAVFNPRFLSGFDLTVDYYNIRVRDAIESLLAQQAVDECARGSTAACSFIARTNGVITSIRLPYYNLSSLSTRGVDVEATWRVPVERWFGGSGRATIRQLVGYVDRLATSTPGAATVNRAGEYQPALSTVPRWKGLSTVNYSQDGFALFVQGRYFGPGKYNNTFTDADADFNRIKAQFYVDGQIGYTIKDARQSIELYLNVQNLLDHQPPFVPLIANANLTTNPNLYDQVGRTFRVGVRVKM